MLELVNSIEVGDLSGVARTLQTLHSIVGQLGKRGIDIGQLAQRKASEERGRWQTWVSHLIAPYEFKYPK